MNLHDCTNFANEVKISYLATTDGDQPHVRGFMMWFADKSGFYFHTGSTKQVCKQLKANPKIEVCFTRQEDEYSTTMLRVTGEVEFLEDEALKERLFEERPFLKQIDEGSPGIVRIFRIYKGETYFWSIADNLNEANIPRVQF